METLSLLNFDTNKIRNLGERESVYIVIDSLQIWIRNNTQTFLIIYFNKLYPQILIHLNKNENLSTLHKILLLKTIYYTKRIEQTILNYLKLFKDMRWNQFYTCFIMTLQLDIFQQIKCSTKLSLDIIGHKCMMILNCTPSHVIVAKEEENTKELSLYIQFLYMNLFTKLELTLLDLCLELLKEIDI